MDLEKDDLSIAVAKLLSEENKTKSLGEASKELNHYIIQIKELVDTGSITLDELKREIVKHIKKKDDIIPNSLAQILVGCVGENDVCLLKSEKPEDVPFAYDFKTDKLMALSKYNEPITDDTYAVLYITGDPQKISVDSFKLLELKGFKKIKIEYKDIGSSSYKVINIDNIRKYINSKPEKNIMHSVMIIGFILLLILIFYNIQK